MSPASPGSSGAPPSPASPPLVLGTAGHIDHGKTALVRALTGVDTDRLPQERERGISIELGYAPLDLPSGRRVSVVDVPGHERFVRTMVAGATGIDLFLMVVAADDGVMPQTREHAAVLAGLGVGRGVVAVTKADLGDPELAALEASELLPDAEVVACSARTGEGIGAVAEALDRAAATLPGRADDGGAPVLHVDRVFSIRGAGTVVTGTLWSGAIGRGDEVTVQPAGRTARVRGVQVHDEPVERAGAGQRVAVNLVGVEVRDLARGDVLGETEPTYIADAALTLRHAEHGQRVQVHHGTREAPGRLAHLGGRFWQLRLEQPLLARRGDHVVVRSVAPPDTLGGGVILDPQAKKHGPSRDALARLTRLERGDPEGDSPPANEGDSPPSGARRGAAEAQAPSAVSPAEGGDSPPRQQGDCPLGAGALALEERLRAAGHEPPIESELGADVEHLPALREAGRAVRIGRNIWAHPDALAAVDERVRGIIEAEGSITLARLRDELQTSRKFAQALLEHLDAARVTLRRPDDSRVLRRR
jgi:selenocysteine-specific elongation factor